MRRYGPKDPRSPTDPKAEPQDVRPEACSTYVCVQYNRQQCKPSTFMKQLIFAMDSNALAMQQDICPWPPKEPEGLRRYGPKDPRSPTDPKVEPQDVRPEACSTYVCVQYNRQQCKPSTFMKQLIFAMDSNATQALAMQQDICAWSPKEPEACVGTVQKTHAHRRTRK